MRGKLEIKFQTNTYPLFFPLTFAARRKCRSFRNRRFGRPSAWLLRRRHWLTFAQNIFPESRPRRTMVAPRRRQRCRLDQAGDQRYSQNADTELDSCNGLGRPPIVESGAQKLRKFGTTRCTEPERAAVAQPTPAGMLRRAFQAPSRDRRSLKTTRCLRHNRP